MSTNKSCNCKYSCKRYVSHGACHDSCASGECIDVCVTPFAGIQDCLTLLAPVVYDEVGLNLCRTIPNIPTGLPAPPASVRAQVIDICFAGTQDTKTKVTPINGRPNCSLVTLTNLKVTFLLTFYDCCGRILKTENVTATYLPTNKSVEDYCYLDPDTNPSCIEVEIFTPYGTAYAPCSTEGVIQYIGFNTVNNCLRQGLNMLAIPKILNYEMADNTITIGLTVYIKSIYFSQYLIPHKGKAIVPKAEPLPNDDTICMDFVCGDLLDLSIKPLELGPPKCEAQLKEPCQSQCNTCCSPASLESTPT